MAYNKGTISDFKAHGNRYEIGYKGLPDVHEYLGDFWVMSIRIICCNESTSYLIKDLNIDGIALEDLPLWSFNMEEIIGCFSVIKFVNTVSLYDIDFGSSLAFRSREFLKNEDDRHSIISDYGRNYLKNLRGVCFDPALPRIPFFSDEDADKLLSNGITGFDLSLLKL